MFTIGYRKIKKPNIDKMEIQQISIDPSYKPFNLANIQGYNPIYGRFFEMTPENYNLIALNHKYQVADLHTLYDEDGKKVKKDVFVKFSPLLDPLKFITGKYNLKDPQTISLPSLDASSCCPKISNINNCSYTDAFFSYLSNMLFEKHGFVHGVPFYGSALATQNRFRFNLADDLDYVKDTDFFMNNAGKHFTLDENTELLVRDFSGSGSRTNRQKISIIDEVDPVIEVDDLTFGAPIELYVDYGNETLLEYEKPIEEEKPCADESDDSSGSSCSDETEDEEEEEEEEEEKEGDEGEDDDSENWKTESSESNEDEEPMYCYLHDFPVQMIFQERCDGTMDELLMKNTIGPDELIACLFQIIMILLTYQKAFDFTHNDLHTNNIMFVRTDEMYLNYRFENVNYCVPTYGRIYKLIDFGRAIYRFQDKTFCSDSFAPNGDAYSQYNCEPFLNESKPRLDPNFSFDLCRLGCSLYDFIVDDDDNKGNKGNDVDSLIKKWCSDDEDKNVVYKKTGQERYPSFKLYKMIARTVHKHTPKNQLSSPVFASFIKESMSGPLMNIDEIPRYKTKE